MKLGMQGIAYYKFRDYTKAKKSLKKALEINKLYLGEKHTNVARCYYGLGIVYTALGRSNFGLEYQQKALEIYKKQLGEDHPDLADVYNGIGICYR
mmetsp:Transcript_39333/g.35025  ORF Transcript_39333/g.35025 Transcript_39333/m.35025 type:complete len:96 (+) Transcript_39333:1-288(+)